MSLSAPFSQCPPAKHSNNKKPISFFGTIWALNKLLEMYSFGDEDKEYAS